MPMEKEPTIASMSYFGLMVEGGKGHSQANREQAEKHAPSHLKQECCIQKNRVFSAGMLDDIQPNSEVGEDFEAGQEDVDQRHQSERFGIKQQSRQNQDGQKL